MCGNNLEIKTCKKTTLVRKDGEKDKQEDLFHYTFNCINYVYNEHFQLNHYISNTYYWKPSFHSKVVFLCFFNSALFLLQVHLYLK